MPGEGAMTEPLHIVKIENIHWEVGGPAATRGDIFELEDYAHVETQLIWLVPFVGHPISDERYSSSARWR